MFRHIYTHSFRSSQDAITEMARKALHRVDCQVSFQSDPMIRCLIFSQLDVLCKWWFKIDFIKKKTFKVG